MGYSTESTEWPNFGVASATKDLIDYFFSLLDDPNENVGDKLADEIFTADGSIVAIGLTASGTAELRKCRENAWKVVTKRRHVIKKVYTYSDECSDLMLKGTVEMGLKNGISVVGEFTANIVLSSEPKISLYQVWADSAPMTKALSTA